jgi:hypothetical protein
MEALKSLDWAGSGNYVFNTIDDIVRVLELKKTYHLNLLRQENFLSERII